MDIVKLTSHMDTTVVAARRHLFTYMVQTGLAFWAWPKEIWVEVIQAGPGRTHTSGTRFWMLLLAYLFCDVLYVGAFTAYGAMAEVIFGQSVVAAEVDKVRTPLVEAGYAADQKEGGRLQWLTALCMLVNRNPSIEAFSDQLLLTVHELLADIPGAAQMTGRWALLRLQTSLCYLGILDEPVILDTSHEKAASLPSLWQNDPTVDPAWLAWVCAFYDQTPTYDERRRRQMCYSLLMAGRWMLSGTGVFGCKSKDILLLLTSYEYQGSHDKIIEEVNSYFSHWISYVASTSVLFWRKRIIDMTEHVCGSLGKCLKMLLGIGKQKLKRTALMIMGDHESRDPPEPLDAIGVWVIGRRILQIRLLLELSKQAAHKEGTGRSVRFEVIGNHDGDPPALL